MEALDCGDKYGFVSSFFGPPKVAAKFIKLLCGFGIQPNAETLPTFLDFPSSPIFHSFLGIHISTSLISLLLIETYGFLSNPDYRLLIRGCQGRVTMALYQLFQPVKAALKVTG